MRPIPRAGPPTGHARLTRILNLTPGFRGLLNAYTYPAMWRCGVYRASAAQFLLGRKPRDRSGGMAVRHAARPGARDRLRDSGTMTAMPGSGDDHRTETAAGQPASAASSPADSPGASSGWRAVPGVSRSIWFLERMQDVVTVAVGIVLIALAAVLLIAGIVDSLDGSWGAISAAAPLLLDRVLLVVILVEIVYTVVLSLRAHRLAAQPFIVVGLIAVIRRILFVLTPGSHITASTSELALLIAMVAVFVAGLIAISRFEKGDE